MVGNLAADDEAKRTDGRTDLREKQRSILCSSRPLNTPQEGKHSSSFDEKIRVFVTACGENPTAKMTTTNVRRC